MCNFYSPQTGGAMLGLVENVGVKDHHASCLQFAGQKNQDLQ